ncbi:angiopoietin-4-like [Drosophila bipectinata]|uniref:angiopoietin-4-like n=1 Tax=Drosophila bipectinata TaxID=42026 RepID=UPI0038B2598A
MELEHLKAQITKSTTQTEDRCHPSPNEKFVAQEIQIPDSEFFKVVCHTKKSTESVYMMVYRKLYNSSKFNHTFEEYTRGFGNVGVMQKEEFFIGLEKLHLLTERNPHELWIFMYPSGHLKEIRCENFVLGSQSEGYMVKTLNGCTEDSSILSQGIKFSTFNRYEDENPLQNKATKLGLGWWFDSRVKRSTLNDAIVLKILRKN